SREIMKSGTKNKLLGAAACLMAVGVATGGTLAYLTDTESYTNTFTVGNVGIALEEPGWALEDADDDGVPDEAEDLVPNEELTKDPQVVNQGVNASLAFIRVIIPVEDVTMIGDDGRLVKSLDENGLPLEYYDREEALDETAAHFPQELFFFKSAEDAVGTHVNNFNTSENYSEAMESDDGNYWIELPVHENFEKVLEDGTTKTNYNTKDQVPGQRVYVFGYNHALKPAEEDGEGGQIYDRTEPLFEKVQLKNIIENEIPNADVQKIKVEAYAIQADNIILSSGEYLTGFDEMADDEKLAA
ncbi:MAG: hypothetical protein IIY77_01635, partial [Lachnospiraceae bacterium]|nr:hypothetical protein [Lachnospiraceae bacterium]